MTHRHRTEHRGAGAAVALAAVLMLVAVGVLAGAWYLVTRGGEQAAAPPPKPISAEEIPFDRPVIVDGEWILEVESVATWREPKEFAELEVRLRECVAFIGDGRFHAFYPEAEGKRPRLRLVCESRPPAELLSRLRGIRTELGAIGLEMYTYDDAGERIVLE